MNSIKFLFLLLILSSFIAYGESWMSINHIVIVSPDLKETVKNYREAGFSVEETGEFKDDFVHNAHIPFMTGGYLELFSPGNQSTWDEFQKLNGKQVELNRALAGQNAIDKRFLTHLTKPQGIADFAVEFDVENSQKKVEELNRAGLKYSAPIKMQRKRLDGKVIDWVVYVSEFEELPFIIQWKTKDEVQESISEQKNLEITGIDYVKIAVKDFDASIQIYTTLLGKEGEILNKGGEEKSKEAIFRLKNEFIYVIEPSGANDEEVESYMSKHGQGAYACGLKTKLQAPYTLSDKLLHGADIKLVSIKN